MSRTLQCANVQSLVNAHSHNTPESRTNDCTLPAQNSLKAAASAVLARTLPRTLAAQSEETARTLPAQSTPECAGNVRLSADAVFNWWMLHYPDGATVEIWTNPPATRAEVMARRPDAVDAVPINQMAPEQSRCCADCVHVTGRGGCGSPVAAGLSDLDGAIVYHDQAGADCPAWMATIPPDLEALIQRTGTYYAYSADDWQLIRDTARRDPDGLRVALETDGAFTP